VKQYTQVCGEKQSHLLSTSGDSRMKKVGGNCGAMEKVGGQHEYPSCMVIFYCFED